MQNPWRLSADTFPNTWNLHPLCARLGSTGVTRRTSHCTFRIGQGLTQHSDGHGVWRYNNTDSCMSGCLTSCLLDTTDILGIPMPENCRFFPFKNQCFLSLAHHQSNCFGCHGYRKLWRSVKYIECSIQPLTIPIVTNGSAILCMHSIAIYVTLWRWNMGKGCDQWTHWHDSTLKNNANRLLCFAIHETGRATLWEVTSNQYNMLSCRFKNKSLVSYFYQK